MLKLRKRILMVAAALAFAASGAFHHAAGQSMRPPHVYNPHTYNNTRTHMSNRAAARAALKRCQKAKAKRRKALRASAGRL